MKMLVVMITITGMSLAQSCQEKKKPATGSEGPLSTKENAVAEAAYAAIKESCTGACHANGVGENRAEAILLTSDSDIQRRLRLLVPLMRGLAL